MKEKINSFIAQFFEKYKEKKSDMYLNKMLKKHKPIANYNNYYLPEEIDFTFLLNIPITTIIKKPSLTYFYFIFIKNKYNIFRYNEDNYLKKDDNIVNVIKKLSFIFDSLFISHKDTLNNLITDDLFFIDVISGMDNLNAKKYCVELFLKKLNPTYLSTLKNLYLSILDKQNPDLQLYNNKFFLTQYLYAYNKKDREIIFHTDMIFPSLFKNVQLLQNFLCANILLTKDQNLYHLENIIYCLFELYDTDIITKNDFQKSLTHIYDTLKSNNIFIEVVKRLGHGLNFNYKNKSTDILSELFNLTPEFYGSIAHLIIGQDFFDQSKRKICIKNHLHLFKHSPQLFIKEEQLQTSCLLIILYGDENDVNTLKDIMNDKNEFLKLLYRALVSSSRLKFYVDSETLAPLILEKSGIIINIIKEFIDSDDIEQFIPALYDFAYMGISKKLSTDDDFTLFKKHPFSWIFRETSNIIFFNKEEPEETFIKMLEASYPFNKDFSLYIKNYKENFPFLQNIDTIEDMTISEMKSLYSKQILKECFDKKIIIDKSVKKRL